MPNKNQNKQKKGKGRGRALVSTIKKNRLGSRGARTIGKIAQATGHPLAASAAFATERALAARGFATPLGPQSGSGSITSAASGAPVAFPRDLNYHSFCQSSPIDGGVLVHSCEYVGDINATGVDFIAGITDGPSGQYMSYYPIFPTNFQLFPVTQTTATNYLKYRLVDLVLHYEHVVPTTQAGGVYLYYNPDVNDQTFQTTSFASTGPQFPLSYNPGNDYAGSNTYLGAVPNSGANSESYVANSQNFAFGACYEDVHLVVDLKAAGLDPLHLLNRSQTIYSPTETGSGVTVPSLVGDFMNIASGFVGFFTTGVTGATVDIPVSLGKIWIETKFELVNLQISNASQPAMTLMKSIDFSRSLTTEEKRAWCHAVVDKFYDGKPLNSPLVIHLDPCHPAFVDNVARARRLKKEADTLAQERREVKAMFAGSETLYDLVDLGGPSVVQDPYSQQAQRVLARARAPGSY